MLTVQDVAVQSLSAWALLGLLLLSSTALVSAKDLGTRDGTAERDYIHVWDLVGAHMDALAAMLAKSVQGKQCVSDVYNLGTGTPVSVQQMLTAVKALFPEANFTVDMKPPRLGDPVSIYANPSKAWMASQHQEYHQSMKPLHCT